jgi:hypothetical protein
MQIFDLADLWDFDLVIVDVQEAAGKRCRSHQEIPQISS